MRIQKRPYKWAVLAALIAMCTILVSCSGPPSESTGRQFLERQIANQSQGKIKLVRFSKINGIVDNNIYQLEYEAEIEFVSDGAWTRGNSMDPSPSFGFSDQQMSSSPTAQLLGSISGSTNVRRGQHETVKARIRFEKTEKGWRAEDGNIY